MDNKGQSYPPPPGYSSPPPQAHYQPPQNHYQPPPAQNASYLNHQSQGQGQQQYYPPPQDQRYGGHQQPHYQPYAPQPQPQTVYVQQQPQHGGSNDAMCMGCLAALCFCCAMDALF